MRPVRALLGRNARPVRSGLYCSTSCMYNAPRKVSPKPPTGIMTLTSDALPSVRLRRTRGGINGVGALDSTMTNSTANTMAPNKVPMVAGDPQPAFPALTMAYTARVGAAVTSTAPSRSAPAPNPKPGWRSISLRPITRATTPTGTLMKKIQCQFSRVRIDPPTTRPRETPPMATKVKMLRARVCSLGSGNMGEMIPSTMAATKAAVVPWTKRAATRNPAFGARPQTIDAALNAPRPMRKSLVRPRRSPRRPARRMRPPKLRRYALTTHASDACEKCNSRSNARQGHVDHRGVQHDHQLADTQHDERRPSTPFSPYTLPLTLALPFHQYLPHYRFGAAHLRAPLGSGAAGSRPEPHLEGSRPSQESADHPGRKPRDALPVGRLTLAAGSTASPGCQIGSVRREIWHYPAPGRRFHPRLAR